MVNCDDARERMKLGNKNLHKTNKELYVYMYIYYVLMRSGIKKNNFAKDERPVVEDLEGVLPATAGATA